MRTHLLFLSDKGREQETSAHRLTSFRYLIKEGNVGEGCTQLKVMPLSCCSIVKCNPV